MLKNIVIITIINHLKLNMNNLSYNFVKKLYNYKSGEEISTTLSVEEAQQNIRLMIINNEWNNITSAKIVNSLKIIYINYDTQNISIKKKLEFKIIIFFSYWSIGNFISLYFIPLIHAIIEVYRYKSRNIIPNYYKIINTILALIIIYIYNNTILAAFFTAFGYPIFINNLTISFFNYLLKKKNTLIEMHFNKIKLIYMIKYTYWILINNCIINTYDNYYYIFNNIYNIGSLLIINLINNYVHKIIYIILYITNIINNNNLLNLFLNFYLIFILYNLCEIVNFKNIVNDSNILNSNILNSNILNSNIIVNNRIITKNNKTNNNEKYFYDDENNKYKYLLEESMIII